MFVFEREKNYYWVRMTSVLMAAKDIFFWIMEGEGSLKFRQVAVVQCDDEAIVLRFERERVI